MLRVPKNLEPIAADTPLAALFNQWLTALAPVEQLTSARRPKSYTRTALQNLTTRLHRLHHCVGRAIDRLEAGVPIEKLAPLFVEDSIKKIGVGVHLRERDLLFIYAAKGATIGGPGALSRLNMLMPGTHEARAREISAFTPIRLQIEAVLWLNQEANTQYYFMKETEADRKQLLATLRGLLGVPKNNPTARKGQHSKRSLTGNYPANGIGVVKCATIVN
jgi:hypothetical protein